MSKQLKNIYNMKTFLFILVCSGLLLFVSCERDVLDPVVLDKPVIETTVSPGEIIPYNTAASISYKNLYTKTCTINGKEVSCSGDFNTGLLTETTIYHFVSTGEGGITKKDVTINVTSALAPTLIIDKTGFKENISFGDKINFSWKADGLVNSVTLNDKPVEKEGYYYSPRLLDKTDYVLKVIGPGGEKVEKLTVSVGSFESSVFGLLTVQPWKLVSSITLNSDLSKKDTLVFNQTERFVLKTDEKFSYFWNDKEVSYGNFSLKDNDKTLMFEDTPLYIREISKTRFVYYQKITNSTDYVQYGYTH